MTTGDERYQRGLAVREKLFGPATAPPLPPDDLFADFRRLIMEFAFGDVWSRPGLDVKTRSFCTMAALIALDRGPEVRAHMRGALNLGITKEEIRELIIHLAVYGGFPVAVNAMAAAREVFDQYDQAPSTAQR